MSCQNDTGLGPNDYSLQTANVGIASISTANPSLTGANATPVFTATQSMNGSIVKTIRIKATSPVTTGMVRLFVGGKTQIALYKEVPIQITPALRSTPTPTPALPKFEIMLQDGLLLQTGDILYATTQNAQAFNIIAEGMDWEYPVNLPPACCNFMQKTATTDTAVVQGNPIVPIYSSPSAINGSYISDITIKALQPTAINGMISLYISPDGANWTLINEIMVPQANQSGYDPSWRMIFNLNMYLNAGYHIGASSLVAEGFAFTVDAYGWTYPIS